MPLPPWARALPNRGHLYERLVLDTLPRGHRALARGGPAAPFDLLVRAPGGTVHAWEVKGNELDERGGFPERRRFSTTPRQLDWILRHRDRVRLCLLWLDPIHDRFGWRILPAEEVRWKSPASPKWVLPPDRPIPLRRSLARYHDDAAGERLRAAWDALPVAHEMPAAARPAPA